MGLPVLFVHGGPGAGCEEYHRRFFDPTLSHHPV
jgi:proline iminopeptidase